MPATLFIARHGAKFDGHDFIIAAQQHGAVAALVERRVNIDNPQILVTNTTLSLGKMAAWKRQQFSGKVITLTGSCGKTTTKEMLTAILQNCGEVLCNMRSFNNEVGLPLTLWQLQPTHKYAVLELGANHFGEINYLSSLAHPANVALITNAEPCHLEGFGDVDGVAKAKAEIFAGLAIDGTAVLNMDDPHFSYWKTLIEKHAAITFGFSSNADVSATEIKYNDLGYPSFVLNLPSEKMPINLSVIGRHNIFNALGAAAVATALDISPADIKKGLENVAPVAMRLNIKPGFAGACIIDDTYNANPTAVAAALDILLQQKGEKIFVFGCMRELGREAEKWHEYIGKLAKQKGIDALYVCGDFREIVAQAFGEHSYSFASQEDLIAAVKQILDAHKVVLVKGSRGAAMEQVVKQLVQK
jgi:UDP-N-acetylmuramoyl-tripeptide--D-alanyl-D-alanine ligase